MAPSIEFSHSGAFIRTSSMAEVLQDGKDAPVALDFGDFRPSGSRAEELADLGPGMCQAETAERDGFQLVRETFTLAGDRPARAVRLLFTNNTSETVQVATLTPVVVGSKDLRLSEVPVGQWVYLRQPRHKNDMPASVVLGGDSPGVWDAVRGTPETGGIPPGESPGSLPARFVSADLTVLRGGASSLLLGVFPLDQQLVQSVLDLTPDRQELVRLRVDCQCDGQHLRPGRTLASQWVLIDLDPDCIAAIERYAETLLASHPGSAERKHARGRPPTVWCSWYYYADGCTQGEAQTNLDALVARPLPIDVFQIDECWDQEWGDWYPNVRWPGIAEFAPRVRAAGYRPGIWTCPLLADRRSTTRYHNPHWLLRRRDGERMIFEMGTASFVLDPTHPEVLAYIEDLYRRLTFEWGYTYHKLDFTRAITHPEAVFHDRTKNRAQAYRMAIEAARRGMGAEAYLNVCGGLYGPILGLADAQRTGSDVRSEWPKAPKGEEAHGYGPFTIKQNSFRFWMNRLWDNDPDALMVRRRETAYREEVLSLGRMNDNEALTSALNQYLGGGLVCFTENLAEVEADRLLLLRHCSPSVGSAAIPRDGLEGTRFPSLFDTAVTPTAQGLEAWHTVSVINWHDEPREFQVALDRRTLGAFADRHDRFVVSAFRGRWSREVARGAALRVGPLPPHGCEVLKVQPAQAGRPCVLRTDGHFSMGGTELVSWAPHAGGVRMSVDWRWPVPLTIEVAPAGGSSFANSPAAGPKTVRIPGPEEHPVELDLRYR